MYKIVTSQHAVLSVVDLDRDEDLTRGLTVDQMHAILNACAECLRRGVGRDVFPESAGAIALPK